MVKSFNLEHSIFWSLRSFVDDTEVFKEYSPHPTFFFFFLKQRVPHLGFEVSSPLNPAYAPLLHCWNSLGDAVSSSGPGIWGHMMSPTPRWGFNLHHLVKVLSDFSTVFFFLTCDLRRDTLRQREHPAPYPTFLLVVAAIVDSCPILS